MSSKGLTNLVVLSFIVLAGCAPRQPAEVVERTVITQAQLDEKIGGQFIRIVQPGDTLYSIAFGAGLDVNKIAAWNGISDVSRLQAGERIRLSEPVGFRYPPRRPKKVASVSASTTQNSAVVKSQVQKQEKQTEHGVQPSPQAGVAHRPKGVVNHEPAQAGARPVTNTITAKPKTPDVAKWAWPLRGTLMRRFNISKGQQGIDIQGQRGQSIKASAAGEVVYAGDGLKGYGNLIIIKHTADYLSAYAHNQVITVSEGQHIQQGQEIAKLGLNLQGQSIAQFQIRKNGNPVNPMLYLN